MENKTSQDTLLLASQDSRATEREKTDEHIIECARDTAS